MFVARSLNEIVPALGGVCVPTMGAMHVGHAALIRAAVDVARAQRLAAGAVVTIFVNPAQFNERADFDRYPRDLDRDITFAADAGANCVFAPDVETVYPPDAPPTAPPLPQVAATPGLEDTYRPGHFEGVCKVVHRLFDLLKPAAAIFGEKDWQQLQAVKAMVADCHLPVEIVGCPTVRELTGLAASSRNRLLSDDDRARALAIPRALEAAAESAAPDHAQRIMRDMLTASDLTVEYAVVRDTQTLLPFVNARSALERPGRALIAARVGETGVRLIDNAPWGRIGP